mgnify:CR=1
MKSQALDRLKKGHVSLQRRPIALHDGGLIQPTPSLYAYAPVPTSKSVPCLTGWCIILSGLYASNTVTKIFHLNFFLFPFLLPSLQEMICRRVEKE